VKATATVAGSESSSDGPVEAMEAPAEGKWCRRPLDNFPSLGIFAGSELNEEA